MSDPKKLTPGGNTLTDWSYTTSIDKTGATIHEVTHDNENFAARVGLIKSYARLANADGTKFVPFNLGDKSGQVGQALTLNKQPARSPDYHYQLSHKVAHKFQMLDFENSGQQLSITQMFGFTETSDTPRHETANVAAAGRFYPSLEFFTPRVPKETDEAIDELRFDFWIEPSIGPGGKRRASTINPGSEMIIDYIDSFFAENVRSSVKQQAGLFRDRDHAVTTRMYEDLHPFSFAASKVFSNAEKPVVYEVAANGMTSGGRDGWDNIHIWGHSKWGLVSTPGMPWGMHLHWRWAAGAVDKTSMLFGDWTPDFLIDPELAGRDINNNPVPGGPLIDPRNQDTDLRVAWVTKDMASSYAKEKATSGTEFVEIFERLAKDPANVKDGAEGMVCIISIVVRRDERDNDWTGTVFPHGFFFPHAYDTGYFVEVGLTFAGAYSEQYLTKKPRRKWWRDPS